MTMKSTTPGPWIVNTNKVKGSPDQTRKICVLSLSPKPLIVAICGTEGAPQEDVCIANAALIAIAPDMMDCLIAIQQTLMSDKEVIDLEAMNEMISGVFAKLANEAGEEL